MRPRTVYTLNRLDEQGLASFGRTRLDTASDELRRLHREHIRGKALERITPARAAQRKERGW
jgi:hypothetical protein